MSGVSSPSSTYRPTPFAILLDREPPESPEKTCIVFTFPISLMAIHLQQEIWKLKFLRSFLQIRRKPTLDDSIPAWTK
jgi:hypothetical protein